MSKCINIKTKCVKVYEVTNHIVLWNKGKEKLGHCNELDRLTIVELISRPQNNKYITQQCSQYKNIFLQFWIITILFLSCNYDKSMEFSKILQRVSLIIWYHTISVKVRAITSSKTSLITSKSECIMIHSCLASSQVMMPVLPLKNIHDLCTSSQGASQVTTSSRLSSLSTGTREKQRTSIRKKLYLKVNLLDLGIVLN